MFGQLSSITLWRRAELVARPRRQAQSRVQGGAGRTRKLRGARTGRTRSPASRGWSAAPTCPMRGACDRWVMSRPRAVAPHLDLSLNTYAGLGRPHRAVLTCLTMSGSFRRVLVTITVTGARARASKSARIQVGASKSASSAAHLMRGRCVRAVPDWLDARPRGKYLPPVLARARHGMDAVAAPVPISLGLTW